MRIEPVTEELTRRAGDAVASGATSRELVGVLGYHQGLLEAHLAKVSAPRPQSLLGERLTELVRLRSSQLGGCRVCQSARYSDEVDEPDVACLVVGEPSAFDERERRALEFVRLMHTDHLAIDDTVYRRLHEVFTTAEIVELGMQTAGLVGLHRFLGTLDLMSSAPAAVAFDPSDVHALEDAR